MKRFAMVFAALALTGAMAFAEDAAPVAQLSGYVSAGIQVVSTDSTTTYTYHSNDWGDDGAFGTLSGSIAGSNFGITVTVDVNGTAGTVVPDTYNAWVSPFEGLRLEGGSGNSNPVGELDDNGNGTVGGAGLAAFYTNSGFTVGALAAASATGSTNGIPLAFGARYALAEVATLNLSAKTTDEYALDGYYFTASLAAVPNLTLTAGYNSSDVSTTASSLVDATVGYQVTPAFYAGVVVYDHLSGTAYFTYKPNVSYTVSPELALSAYYLGGTSTNFDSQVQVQGSYTFNANAKTTATVLYDANPTNVDTAVPKTTVSLDLIFSF